MIINTKTAILLLTMQMVACMRILTAYFGISGFDDYLKLMNIMMLSTYGTISLVAGIVFLKNLRG